MNPTFFPAGSAGSLGSTSQVHQLDHWQRRRLEPVALHHPSAGGTLAARWNDGVPVERNHEDFPLSNGLWGYISWISRGIFSWDIQYSDQVHDMYIYIV